MGSLKKLGSELERAELLRGGGSRRAWCFFRGHAWGKGGMSGRGLRGRRDEGRLGGKRILCGRCVAMDFHLQILGEQVTVGVEAPAGAVSGRELVPAVCKIA